MGNKPTREVKWNHEKSIQKGRNREKRRTKGRQ